ncbi:hypothetical protein PCS_01343 [Desulfocurvibacter africanus PCS]|uniref:Uncharacterized protein n=1 Tax=Desulfocurvibacter africanus PCS TaxID=1262666 RepID=M5PUD0_DESAF|nr:hypothetical protein PCS_01343 [Desulfocurvibacter africanus PCS]
MVFIQRYWIGYLAKYVIRKLFPSEQIWSVGTLLRMHVRSWRERYGLECFYAQVELQPAIIQESRRRLLVGRPQLSRLS